MKTRRITILFASLLGFACCDPGSLSEEEVTFSFSAATSGYASLKEAVFVDVDNAGGGEVCVDWGDGSMDSGSDAKISHRYTTAGKYTVTATIKKKQEKWEIEIGPLLALGEAVRELYGTPGKVWVMTHRGHTTDRRIPENSVAAVKAAIEAGADVIETDTHRTRDGKIVISHDENIDNHTNGVGRIPGMTLSAIRNFNLTDRNGMVTGEKMPTLEEFLLAARGKVYVNLDYSPRTASTGEVMEIVGRLGMTQQVFMYCKDSSYVREVFGANPMANAYTRSEDWTALLEGPEQYFLQVGWNSGQTDKSECVIRCLDAYDKGVLCSVNLLHVNHSYIPEYEIDENQLASLFKLYPECQMVHTDCPREMIEILKSQGRR